MSGLSCTNWRRDVLERVELGLKEGARLPFWVALAGTVLIALSLAASGGAA